ncbi:hypothetical protein FAI41_08995 [Acetobacteraceae bacterium]|nr:hypothetical protein FAI41_08995 [Acetobacteraceae bacterium]
MNKKIFLTSISLVLASCSPDLATPDPYGTWFGTLQTDEGFCPTNAPSTLRIYGKEMVFAAANGPLILHGKHLQKETHFILSLTKEGMDGVPFHMLFNGWPDGATIKGVYATPRCRAHITLRRW